MTGGLIAALAAPLLFFVAPHARYAGMVIGNFDVHPILLDLVAALLARSKLKA